MKIKHAEILDLCSVEHVNDFIKDKNIEEIVPIIKNNSRNGKIIDDYIWGYIVYWWEENRK